MKVLNNIDVKAVSGGDDWYRYSGGSSSISPSQSAVLADCVGGAAGHDGGSAAACAMFLLFR